ncbi:MAG: hypothetical protein U0T56_05855 [Ferruginibacter sp.]
MCGYQATGYGINAVNSGAGCITSSVLWYNFATQTSHFLKMHGADRVALFSAASCSEPMTQLLCHGESCLDNMNQFSMNNLVVGTTYYLAVAGNDFYFCLLSADNDELLPPRR